MAQQYEDILVDIADDVCTVTLNRPHRLNAWTGQDVGGDVRRDRRGEFESRCWRDCHHRCAGRGFCAGADIKDNFKARLDDSGESVAMRGDWIELVRSSKPLIAAVNGACVGIGATMILPMDVIVASDQATLRHGFRQNGCDA